MSDVFEDWTPQAPELPFWFQQVHAGPHENFHYLFGDPHSREAAVIDPAFRLPQLFALAEAEGYQVRTAFFTHGHWDHIGGIPDIFDLGVERVVVHEAAGTHPKVVEAGEKAYLVKDGDVVHVGALPVHVVHTPGHQPEGACFLLGPDDGEQALFGGDTLFIDSCGRTDFPGGDTDAMFASMARLRAMASPHIHVFPGHHYAKRPWRTLDDESRENPALATTDRTAFDALPFLRG